MYLVVVIFINTIFFLLLTTFKSIKLNQTNTTIQTPQTTQPHNPQPQPTTHNPFPINHVNRRYNRQDFDFNNSSSSNTLSSLSTGNTRIPPQQRKLSHLFPIPHLPNYIKKSFEDDNVTNNTSDINNKHKNLNKPTNDELTTRIKSIQQLADRTIDSILKGLPLERSFGYLNYEFTKLCRYKHVEQSKLSDLIFEKIINDFKTNLKPSIIEILHDNYQDTDSIIQLVKNFLNLFTNWYFRMSDLSKVFIYLDNHYLVQHRTKHPIMLFAIDLFINEVFVEDKQLAKKY